MKIIVMADTHYVQSDGSDVHPELLERDGVRVAVVNVLEGGQLSSEQREQLGGDVDVILHGNTHEASIEERGGVLLVNPGSPTYPAPEGAAPTYARLLLEDGAARAELVELPKKA